ncbi:Cell wall integrity protein [Komagataella phaffii CBS 7435]|uniref:Uncharacterized protein n=2 Tax=Komagataella phaffii TaxID=460519 RepID=C4QY67_KOMPG|nr:uncharacterized protein PAS_chr1-4_0348 [Komagataella phaffii GS115]AOA60463.1 GQ67_01820T0 [Komagataella phaffii]CAH2447011.1 Cell wall integrity protein [Komagataella phaffii CBS 7435]AOA66687.1 GQ68_01836T0 [Komagataella phaffii GS115]CAY68190.1 Putative protein of unknown function [Komagataella phaffii GS115]SCV11896.1 Cell wall integrity protein [Komagataella phaffii CBS 7435]
MSALRSIHSSFIRLNIELNVGVEGFNEQTEAISLISKGQYLKVLNLPLFKKIFTDNSEIKHIIAKYTQQSSASALVVLDLVNHIIMQLSKNLESLSPEVVKTTVLILGVIFLQLFLQENFTGPSIPFENEKLPLGILRDLLKLNKEASTHILSVGGETAYELMESPILLVLSVKILEEVSGSSVSVLSKDFIDMDSETFISKCNIVTNPDVVQSSIQWWKSRAYMVFASVLTGEVSLLTLLPIKLLTPNIVSTLIDLQNKNSPENQEILVLYQLESASVNFSAGVDNSVKDALAKAKTASGLQLILTGCKAKRTKFQQTGNHALLVLAKSQDEFLRSTSSDELSCESPEELQLNDEVLLERPYYEPLEEENTLESEEKDSKRVKIDFSFEPILGSEEDSEVKLLPIALKDDEIPPVLKSLDPNNQPQLASLDMAQLLMRLIFIRENTPSNSAMVESELMALVQRITNSKNVNWTIFSKSLWERSLLEASKSKTIERGVLQMQVLVEDLGMNSVKTRMFSQSGDEQKFLKALIDPDDFQVTPNAARLKYIFQLPLTPRWALDSLLAEKLMSIGVIKSALQIYERLNLSVDAALCYALTGDEAQAEKILVERIAAHPSDARALSVLGDVKQSPELWLKSWEVGKYSKAKVSLGKYYYQPPKDSGLTKDLPAAIGHIFDALTRNPVDFETWFFYGCMGIEASNWNLAAEAFTRCVSIDNSSPQSWSNLASALIKLGKNKEAFSALKSAIRTSQDKKVSSKIWDNFLIVAAKLSDWTSVLLASRELLTLRSNSKSSEEIVDLPVVEKLVQVLLESPYPGSEDSMDYFQKSCVDFICTMLPQVINNSDRSWRIVSRVELWRKRPWMALECNEKAYRAAVNNPELEFNETAWKTAVDACADLVAAFESLGELPGKHGADDLVCKDWKYKAKMTVRSLMSKGKSAWEDSEGWNVLQELKNSLMS